MKSNFLLFLSAIFLLGCVNNSSVVKIKNLTNTIGKSSIKLTQISTKQFPLDSVTAPRAQYSQIYLGKDGRRIYTFLNKNNNAIYFFDYKTLKFERKIILSENAFGEHVKPEGYYIKNLDSIYVYNMNCVDVLMINEKGHYFKKISLIANKSLREVSWTLSYPQYNPQTAIPFIATSDQLLLPGQYMMSPGSLIDKFKFTAYINIKNNAVDFYHKYPAKLYGSNANWEGDSFTEIYADLSASKKQLVFSFPVAHDLYLANLRSENYRVIYGGSANAGTISSIDANIRQTSRQMIMDHFIKNDEYAAIKYDPYRKVYYRFLRKAISKPTANTVWQDKPVSIIILDQNFNYLGESVIGNLRNWYIDNTFVTSEGLNIEYIQSKLDESFLTLKIFSIKKL